MKAEFKVKEKEFVPVKVELTFESQEELDFFGSLFNSRPFNNLMLGLIGSKPDGIHAIFHDAGADTYKYTGPMYSNIK